MLERGRTSGEANPANGPVPSDPAPLAGPETLEERVLRLEDAVAHLQDTRQMEERILEAERRLQGCQQAAADPAVASDHRELSARLGALAAVQAEVDSLYARWAELEGKVTL